MRPFVPARSEASSCLGSRPHCTPTSIMTGGLAHAADQSPICPCARVGVRQGSFQNMIFGLLGLMSLVQCLHRLKGEIQAS